MNANEEMLAVNPYADAKYADADLSATYLEYRVC